MRPQAYTENYRHREKLGAGEVGFPRQEEHNNWFPSAKWPALKTYIKEPLYGISRLYLEICIYIHIYHLYKYIYIHMHVTKVSEKEVHEFEGELRGVYGRTWREERERRNVTIL